ncbi:LAMI_0B03510g1_1 [Lachancea mirantina]|uniref:LAMI_0B03510g1_1 n=1 Tax=Lachancea mirantina TaxID=1230905 RepID=A0A1G4IVA6_9SACH|nr:LAMI_0B03510g1_1 [Lachancea mirantina]
MDSSNITNPPLQKRLDSRIPKSFPSVKSGPAPRPATRNHCATPPIPHCLPVRSGPPPCASALPAPRGAPPGCPGLAFRAPLYPTGDNVRGSSPPIAIPSACLQFCASASKPLRTDHRPPGGLPLFFCAAAVRCLLRAGVEPDGKPAVISHLNLRAHLA